VTRVRIKARIIFMDNFIIRCFFSTITRVKKNFESVR
jgi:hypothetical protein